jgi:predicted lactoylglutathione lyase
VDGVQFVWYLLWTAYTRHRQKPIIPLTDTGRHHGHQADLREPSRQEPRATKAFFAALGYTFNPQFTDANAACMVITEDSIHACCWSRRSSRPSPPRASPTPPSTEVLLCLSCESRAEVDELVAKAKAAGGTIPREPQDHGFMYGHGFQDLDGHLWELVFMDPNVEMPKQ